MRGDKCRLGMDVYLHLGSPPHARGQEIFRRFEVCYAGITPACAGTSHENIHLQSAQRDHPRMRGDKSPASRRRALYRGSPPHARGQEKGLLHKFHGAGITPACAGTSTHINFPSSMSRDHPRMRGDKKGATRQEIADQGSPPHARGQAVGNIEVLLGTRITPACAGTRTRAALNNGAAWDHPRMRGDKSIFHFLTIH